MYFLHLTLLCLCIVSRLAFANPNSAFKTGALASEQRPLRYGSGFLQKSPRNDQIPLSLDDGNKSPPECPYVLIELITALYTMQYRFFEIWVGTWPEAIDWTAAAMGTQVSASLHSMSKSAWFDPCPEVHDSLDENLVDRFFSFTTSFYFGENAIGLRTQAFDDMLWVVLGWLEATQFISSHSARHFPDNEGIPSSMIWYANHYIPAFAHRARIFWDLASHGWDTTLCGGGMVWSPYVTPYKNAITNQLWIAASINMYLYFPGDDNASPFNTSTSTTMESPGEKHDPKFLKAAEAGYKWLRNSHMTNEQGLYGDGFHVTGWRGDGDPGSGQCDELNPDVYTYNQGVILTGLRGLLLATGNTDYLTDGHQLIRNVIAATGWSLSQRKANRTGEWQGLGRDGVLEEICDVNGDCSQNAQTFKGIFFHHFTVFCEELPILGQSPDLDSVFHPVDPSVAGLHHRSCAEYEPWVGHNADAAARTRDEEGKFGMWWTPGLDDTIVKRAKPQSPAGSDYRNRGIPDDSLWRLAPGTNETGAMLPGVGPLDGARARPGKAGRADNMHGFTALKDDPNERGRGRTVETQSGGVAVLRAAQLFERLRRDC